MAKRSKMSKSKSKKDFRKKSGVHPKNVDSGAAYIMRGGVRL